MTSMLISSSPMFRLMAFTPMVPRLEARTSLSLKRMAFPNLVATRSSLLPSVSLAETRLSPLRFTALIPPFLGLEKACRGILTMLPLLVTRMMNPVSKLLTGMAPVIRSSGSSCSRLTMDLPRAARPREGTS